jgi:BirA family biotin operon repressor/biotin-[acetyl-CoA-carboxylase] ligase
MSTLNRCLLLLATYYLILYYQFVTEHFTASIIRNLETGFIGQNIFYYPTLASTMDTARQMVRRRATAGTAIIAGEQTAGRGRLKRPWLSPAGNIALSIILYPDITSLPYLMMIASLAAVYSIEVITGIKTGIKWPNDILIDDKKVCGILIENEVKANKVLYSIVGIGINVDLNTNDYPEISATSISLKSENVPDLRLKIVCSLLSEFERLYLKLPDGKYIYQAWRFLLVTLGEKVRATSAGRILEGIAESVDETGALSIRQPDGSLVRVVAGDVTLSEK